MSKLYCWVNKRRREYKKNAKNLSNDIFAVFEILLDWIAGLFDTIDRTFVKRYDFFLSTKYQAPPKIYKEKSVLKLIILHDTIAISHPEFFKVKFRKFRTSWVQHLVNTMNAEEIYLTNSAYTKNDFVQCRPDISNDHFHVVYHACSENFKRCVQESTIYNVKRKYGMTLDQRYVFCLCALEPRKNVIRIIKCFLQFVKKNNICDLVMVIGGSAWNNFIPVIEKELGMLLGDSKYLNFTGYIRDEDLPVLYSGAEWFVYTSQYEGFGVPPLEAMSCGCPVIVSNSASLPEVVGEAGLYVDWDNDKQHIDAYEKYYFNEELRNENSKKGMNRAKQFSWRKSVEQILEIAKDYGSKL